MYPLLSLPFEEEMYPTEKLPFGSLLYVQNDLPFGFCQDDRRIAMFFAPGHYRAAFVVPVPEPLLSATLTVLHSRLMTHITGIKLVPRISFGSLVKSTFPTATTDEGFKVWINLFAESSFPARKNSRNSFKLICICRHFRGK